MGKKKAAGQETVNVKLAPQFLCYYCDTRHEDEYKLVQHQRSKHFLCRLCPPQAYGRNCLSLGGLVSHVRRSHRKEVKEVPNAAEGRESLDVEVSGMNGIPDDVRIEFERKLAEEAEEASREQERAAAERPERQEPEPSRKPRYEPPPEEPKWEAPPLPEEPARPPVAFAMLPETGSSMPHLNDMASRLASQLQQQTSALAMGKEPPPVNLFPFTLPEPATPAFDPGQLAARIAAAKLEAEREERQQAEKEAEAAARARRRDESPLAFKKETVRQREREPEPEPKRPAPKKNSAMRTKLLAMEESAVLKYAMDVGVPEDQLDKVIDAKDAKATIVDFIINLEAKEAWMTVTFKAGKLGITADWATGYVESITPGSQAETNGIKPGMTIKTINGQQYAKSILQAKIGGTRDYKVMFAQSEEIQRAKETEKRNRSRSRKPYRSRSRGRGGRPDHKGSLKFRPRSMNRSPDKKGESDRRDRDNRDEVASNRKTNEDSRKGEYQRRRDEDDRRGGDDRRRDDDRRRGDEGRRDDRRGDKRKRDQSPSPDAKNSRKTGWGNEDKDELTMPLPPQISQMPPTAPMPQGMPGAVLKGEMCMSFTEGLCTKGGMCPYAHSLHELAPGGYKPRLCPTFMRGGCTRGVICMYAHKREELPPNFKCIPCQNYSTGFCRKQQICPFAHGPEEQGWFTEFMGGEAREGGREDPGRSALPALTNIPNVPGMVPPAIPEMSMADNVLAAAEAQLQLGLSSAGQLDMPKVPKAVMKPSSVPKLNLAANPAVKAAAPAAGLMGAAFAKGAGGPPPGAVAKGGSIR